MACLPGAGVAGGRGKGVELGDRRKWGWQCCVSLWGDCVCQCLTPLHMQTPPPPLREGISLFLLRSWGPGSGGQGGDPGEWEARGPGMPLGPSATALGSLSCPPGPHLSPGPHVPGCRALHQRCQKPAAPQCLSVQQSDGPSTIPQLLRAPGAQWKCVSSRIAWK